MPTSARVARLGDAAIEVVARDGLRGLTHRAVDSEAGLPAGSTSYYARTRGALVELTFGRIVELDVEHTELDVDHSAPDVDEIALALADLLHHSITAGRSRTLARYELALEADRRPGLRAVYDRGGARLRDRAAEVVVSLGSDAPRRHAAMLVAWFDGMLFDAVAGAGPVLTQAELVECARDMLRACGGRA
ncbi:TetR/AcrR family transcriptional regulator [Saccharomonospora piscinae]|uniref:TetR/AcrR family transcriptional regulator n=1 Tax=Saccharomonospora piscinae TaxID=687388 RepID=UPI0004637FAE|nr:ABC-F family ATP-binding cassette domain-containing protein [Saccharomonospora piscinae]